MSLSPAQKKFLRSLGHSLKPIVTVGSAGVTPAVTAELDGGPVISQVVIPILETDDAARLAARLGPREHELIVATVDLMTRRRVECDGSLIRVDGDPLRRPFRLQEDGTLDETA